MNYNFHAIFSFIRLTIGFLFVFGFIAPLFFSYIKNKRGIERIVFSWVALGGLLISFIFILVSLSIYDFISILFCLLMLPVVMNYIKGKWAGDVTIDIINKAEHKTIARHILFIEKVQGLNLQQLKEKFLRKPKFSISKPYAFTAILIGILASVIRIIPSFINSSPFSRLWYFELASVKNQSLQVYFGGYPDPKGMYSVIQFFSTITQVSSEMILHIIGPLISFFLCVIIFWALIDLTRGKHKAASVFGTLLFAVFPTLFSPISLELQTELNTLSMALCFAIPTLVFFLRNVRSGGDVPFFYIFIGIIATGLTNLFVLLVVLLPILLLGLLTLPKKNYFTNFGKTLLQLIASYSLVLAPFVGYCLINSIELSEFIQDQLFNTQVFSLSSNQILPIEELSVMYMCIAGALFLGYMIRNVIQKKWRFSETVIFILYFAMVSYLYSPYFEYRYIYIDPDQLNLFYGIMVSIFGGLLVYSLFEFLEWAIKSYQNISTYFEPISILVLSVGIMILQNGFEISRTLPKTEPNGFFEAYYNIINERIPYTYATVGPQIDAELATNRHYFMNYQFFLERYGVIDSLYQQYMMVPVRERDKDAEVPPASIFLFVEKPPYGSIQQGILYNSQAVMRDMEQWLLSYQKLEGRNLKVYYETDNAIVYEIINREGESTVSGVLGNIYEDEESRVFKLFK